MFNLGNKRTRQHSTHSTQHSILPTFGKYGLMGSFGGITFARHAENDDGGGGGGSGDEAGNKEVQDDPNKDGQWDPNRQRNNEIKGLNRKISAMQVDFDTVKSERDQARNQLNDLMKTVGGDKDKLTPEQLEDFSLLSDVVIKNNNRLTEISNENKQLKETVTNQQELISSFARYQAGIEGQQWLDTELGGLEQTNGFSQSLRNEVIAQIDEFVEQTEGFMDMPIKSRRKMILERAGNAYNALSKSKSTAKKSSTDDTTDPAILDSGGRSAGPGVIQEGGLDEVAEQMMSGHY